MTLNLETSNFLILNHRLVIRGRESDEAVLCSSSASYLIKKVQITNTMLLLDPEGVAVDSLDYYFELKQTTPGFDKLLNLLQKYPYTGAAEVKEYKVNTKMIQE